MSVLYIRGKDELLKTRYVNEVHSLKELKEIIADHLPGRPLLLGDLTTICKATSGLSVLLKFLEDNPEIDCYSSRDELDAILMSRFTEIHKMPQKLSSYTDDEAWDSSLHDYYNVVQMQGGCSTDVKLRLPLLNKRLEQLIKSL